MTPENLNKAEKHALDNLRTTDHALWTACTDVLALAAEVRRLQEAESASRLFGMIVPPCECGAYENKTKPCSANCRLDVKFRTALFGDAQVSP